MVDINVLMICVRCRSFDIWGVRYWICAAGTISYNVEYAVFGKVRANFVEGQGETAVLVVVLCLLDSPSESKVSLIAPSSIFHTLPSDGVVSTMSLYVKLIFSLLAVIVY